MAGNTSVPGRSVTSRVLAILTAFDEAHREQPLCELSRRAGLSLTTTHRLVGELAAGGALVRDQAGRYSIGHRVWELGLLAPTMDLCEAAAPFLGDVHATTGAQAHLAVRDGTDVLYVDRAADHASVPIVSTVGSRLPLYATGVGKVLLAYAPKQVVEAVLRDLHRVTPYTVTQPSRLVAQLRRVRADGYATTSEEMSLGAYSVAVPVVDAEGRVRAAIGVVGPALGRRLDEYRTALRSAARGIGRQLGRSAERVGLTEPTPLT